MQLPALPDVEARFLTPDEVERLDLAVQETAPHWAEVVPVLADPGLRIGEAAALTVGDVDLEGGIVQVRRGLVEVCGVIQIGPPKSRHSRRAIPMLTESTATRVADRIRRLDLRSHDPLFVGRRGGWLRPHGLPQPSVQTICHSCRVGRIGHAAHAAPHSCGAVDQVRRHRSLQAVALGRTPRRQHALPHLLAVGFGFGDAPNRATRHHHHRPTGRAPKRRMQDMVRYDVGSNADVLAAFESTVVADRDLPLPKIGPSALARARGPP